MKEDSPVSKIVDAETFGFYLIDYRTRTLANQQSERIETAASRIKSMYAPDADPHYFITLENVPWDEVPSNLQQAIGKQYDSASLEEEKTISVEIWGVINLVFKLSSPHVQGTTDLYGEIDTSGLELQLDDDDSDSKSKKAMWIIERIPRSIIGKWERALDESFANFADDESLLKKARGEKQKEYLEEARLHVQKREVSLVELQDIAVLLEKFREKTVVRII